MRRLLPLGSILVCLLLTASVASATTQRAKSGDVSAKLVFQGRFPNFRDLKITIARAGRVVYRKAVVSSFCHKLCQPASTTAGASSVRVLDLEHNGKPDVLLRLFSGGAHCCWIDQIFSPNAAGTGVVKTERDFGDPGERLVDLGHNGRREFLTADDAFAFAFTDFAASALPVQILTFSNRRFHDVTRTYPKVVDEQALVLLKSFKRSARRNYSDSVGVIAAWAADEDLLGHTQRVNRYITQQTQAGHIKVVSQPVGADFPARLNRFLRKHGYLS